MPSPRAIRQHQHQQQPTRSGAKSNVRGGATANGRGEKEILVDEAGGRCCLCGYDRCLAALEFHHLDPLEKRLEINAKGTSLALDTLRAEARKCVLLCSNCHAEVEVGATEVPLELRRDVVILYSENQ